MARVTVYRPADGKVFRAVSRHIAAELVARGFAEIIGERAVRLIQKKAAISYSHTASHQGSAYFAAGIETNPRFVQGGLTRDEHRPGQLSRFQGARVGHQ